MQQLPHFYSVTVNGAPQSNLTVQAENLPTLEVAPPRQFDGPGDQWSPEELLMAAIANCLVLSFRAVARASKLSWLSIQCESEGELDKVNGITKFANINTRACLLIPHSESREKAEKLLYKAEKICLISNSLSSQLHFECDIQHNSE